MLLRGLVTVSGHCSLCQTVQGNVDPAAVLTLTRASRPGGAQHEMVPHSLKAQVYLQEIRTKE